MKYQPLIVPDRDALITEFGMMTVQERYLLPGETPQHMFARVASAYADDAEHAQRLYDYISKLWLMPSTPVLSNGGTDRGLPISCYLNYVGDSMTDIARVWDENVWLGSGGGGIGTYWGAVRSVGEPVADRGKTSGVIPFIRVMDTQTLAVSQGSLRRGSGAAYMDVSHPEIEEFLEIRKTSGDFNRKCLNLHHGINIPDEFMELVREDGEWPLVDPKSGKVKKSVRARSLWEKILELRLQTGEPYLLFIDTVREAAPKTYEMLGLKVSQSNLCSEIVLATDEMRTAVCCLASLNLATYDEWKGDKQFIEDALSFLDNVLQDFIDKTEGVHGYERARYSAMRERAVGLGVMGLHSYLQRKRVPFESALAKSINMSMFRFIYGAAQLADYALAIEKGPSLDALECGIMSRFSHKLAIAPTASISIICGQTSPCVEPWAANIFTQKTLSGSYAVKNRELEEIIVDFGSKLFSGNDHDMIEWVNDQWRSILEHEGSVQQLGWLSDDLKAVFKTADEIDQRWIVELAADRQPMIDQAQSINLFMPGDVSKRDLHYIHWMAWERGVKSLYYLRSKSVQRAGTSGSVASDNTMARPVVRVDYEECLACQ